MGLGQTGAADEGLHHIQPEAGAGPQEPLGLLGVSGEAVGGVQRTRTCCELLWDCRLDWSRLSRGAPFLDSLLSSQ